MTRLSLTAFMLASLFACDLDENPCDRWAEFQCNNCGLSASECDDVFATINDPSQDNADFCAAEMAAQLLGEDICEE
ncbi:MAG: hypothetical protein ACON5B_09705 [Myxococcota bacterium]